MKTFYMIVWLLPVIFMLHDFEEVIMIRAWLQRNKSYIRARKGKPVPFNIQASTASFTVAVAIEFVILSVITILSYLLDNYVVWYGAFAGFTVHLVFHLYQWIRFKKYVPSALTSVVFLPVCCYFLYKSAVFLGYDALTLILSTLIFTVIIAVNIAVLHKLMVRFDRWLDQYKLTVN
ncbi:HXXEE domain-containing protein [Paenibacillus durus]|uniref:Membrane protein n=1 Tax=Paenibacillus durus TaxID=44251 RepID=A0A089HTP7_PAEDU|nr:HXXEE domain-containing protein [Paenibacillus durus]AIQ13748.1 membrane protein [Paenibacillus durus]